METDKLPPKQNIIILEKNLINKTVIIIYHRLRSTPYKSPKGPKSLKWTKISVGNR